MPEVKNFDESALFVDPIVDQVGVCTNWRTVGAADTGLPT
jgi:hypothetical protein